MSAPARITLRLLALAWLLCLAALVAGCGGGGDADDGMVDPPRVDCAMHPELCK